MYVCVRERGGVKIRIWVTLLKVIILPIALLVPHTVVTSLTIHERTRARKPNPNSEHSKTHRRTDQRIGHCLDRSRYCMSCSSRCCRSPHTRYLRSRRGSSCHGGRHLTCTCGCGVCGVCVKIRIWVMILKVIILPIALLVPRIVATLLSLVQDPPSGIKDDKQESLVADPQIRRITSSMLVPSQSNLHRSCHTQEGAENGLPCCMPATRTRPLATYSYNHIHAHLPPRPSRHACIKPGADSSASGVGIGTSRAPP